MTHASLGENPAAVLAVIETAPERYLQRDLALHGAAQEHPGRVNHPVPASAVLSRLAARESSVVWQLHPDERHRLAKHLEVKYCNFSTDNEEEVPVSTL